MSARSDETPGRSREQRRRGYLSIIQLSESGARVGQQEVSAQDGHFIAKLHVLQWAVRHRPLLQIDYPAVHEEGRVDQLCDFCQVPLTDTETEQRGHTWTATSQVC